MYIPLHYPSSHLVHLQGHRVQQIKAALREQDFDTKQYCQLGEMAERIWMRNAQRLFAAAGLVTWTFCENGEQAIRKRHFRKTSGIMLDHELNKTTRTCRKKVIISVGCINAAQPIADKR